MREFEYIFDRGLMNGVRKTKRSRVKDQQIIEAYNFQLGQDGLEPYSSIEIVTAWADLISSTDELARQMPTVFNGSKYSYMSRFIEATDTTALYSINSSTLAVSSINTHLGTEVLSSVADFGDYAVFAGSGRMVVVDKISSTVTAFVDSADMPNMQTCCNFRGQLVGGNIGSASLWQGATGTNRIVFSEIGSILMQHLDGSGDLKGTTSLVAGDTFIPTGHEIRKVLPLLDHVIVYTTGDIWALTPVIEPTPAFKLTQIASTGIEHSRAVDGGLSRHLLVDYTGDVWIIGNDLKPVRQGYKEFFADYSDDVTVVFDQGTDEWRINTADDAYVCANGGLTSCYQKLSGIYGSASYYMAVGIEDDDRSGRIVTDSIDFGYRAIKTVHGIELGIDNSARTLAGFDVRYSTKETFRRMRLNRVNSIGQSAEPQSGTDFRIVVSFDQYQDAWLDWIKLRYKMSDMRGLRGVYAPAPRGQYAS